MFFVKKKIEPTNVSYAPLCSEHTFQFYLDTSVTRSNLYWVYIAFIFIYLTTAILIQINQLFYQKKVGNPDLFGMVEPIDSLYWGKSIYIERDLSTLLGFWRFIKTSLFKRAFEDVEV